MKKVILIFALLAGTVSYSNVANAQNVNISINIGTQPAWGPVGYDYVGFYYFPDINCYYDVNMMRFVYLHNGRWVHARYLPSMYARYDLYNMYKVVLVDVRNPWLHNSNHRRQYVSYVGYRPQVVIRDSRDARYRDSRKNTVAWRSEGRSHVSSNEKGRNNEQIRRSSGNIGQRNSVSQNQGNSKSDNGRKIEQNRRTAESTQNNSQRSTSNSRTVSRR